MVALNTPRFGFQPTLNFARGFLFRAADALEAGRLIEAGVLLREAVRRQLWSECNWFGCLPDGASDRTPPRVLLKALQQSGHTDETGYERAIEAIEFGNRAAHCRYVRADYLRATILVLHNIIDSTPCNEPQNMAGLPQPEPCCCDADDDEIDPADWWKREGGGE